MIQTGTVPRGFVVHASTHTVVFGLILYMSHMYNIALLPFWNLQGPSWCVYQFLEGGTPYTIGVQG